MFKEKVNTQNASNKSEGSISDELQTRNQRLTQETLWVFDSEANMNLPQVVIFMKFMKLATWIQLEYFVVLLLKLDTDVFPRGLTDRSAKILFSIIKPGLNIYFNSSSQLFSY